MTKPEFTVGSIVYGPPGVATFSGPPPVPLLAKRPRLSAEHRASQFIDWCTLHGLGSQDWPPGSYNQLVAHLRAAANGE
jgi:hypothetical protein